MWEYIDSFTDIGFKFVFGNEISSDEILRVILNDVFEGQEDFGRILTRIYTFNNISDMQTIPFTHRDVLERLAKISNEAALSDEERCLYDYDVKRARDYKSEMTESRSYGHSIGYNEGRAEVAFGLDCNMTPLGLGSDVMAAVTGLSPEDIAA